MCPARVDESKSVNAYCLTTGNESKLTLSSTVGVMVYSVELFACEVISDVLHFLYFHF